MKDDIGHITVTAYTGATYSFYYNKRDPRSIDFFKDENEAVYREKLQNVVDILEDEKKKNPAQTVSNKIFIPPHTSKSPQDRVNMSVLYSVSEEREGPFMPYFGNHDEEGVLVERTLKINTVMLNEFSKSMIGAVLEHELGHVIEGSMPVMYDPDIIDKAHFNATLFSSHIAKKTEEIEARNNQNKKDLEANVDKLFTREATNKNHDIIEAFAQHLHDQGKHRHAKKLKRFKDKRLEEMPKNLQKECKQFLMNHAINSGRVNTQTELVEIDLMNEDFQNYVKQAKELRDANTALFTYADTHFSDSKDIESPHDFANHVKEHGIQEKCLKVLRLYNAATVASQNLLLNPYGNSYIPSQGGTANVETSTYKLDDNQFYALPESMDEKERNNYIELFKSLKESENMYSNNRTLFNNVRLYDEAVADLNINTHIKGGLEVFNYFKGNPPTRLEKAFQSLNSEPVHPDYSDRIRYLEQSAGKKVSEAKKELEEFLNENSEGGTTITQNELDDIVSIAGDLVEEINSPGPNDSISLYDGAKTETHAVTFRDNTVSRSR